MLAVLLIAVVVVVVVALLCSALLVGCSFRQLSLEIILAFTVFFWYFFHAPRPFAAPAAAAAFCPSSIYAN